MRDLSGQTIKGYTLLETLGVGGFGTVYRATQPSVSREVAVKVILPQYANQPEFIRRFEAEAQLIARLEHPFIVPLYDYWRDPTGAYLIMRYLRGGSLKDRIATGVGLPLTEVARMIDQVCSALAVAHRANIIHRDLKPENVLLDEDDNAYLSDFGIAKDLGIEANITEVGAVVGSPVYISPEQIRGELASPLSDIYSLGIMLYELFTAQKPFPGANTSTLLYKHLQEPLPLVTTVRADLPTDIDQIIQRATAKTPADRYQNVLAISNALRQLATLSEAVAVSQTGTTTRQRITASINTPSHFSLPEPENPYKGLRAFRESDAADFFGRATLVDQLLTHLQNERHQRFLAVVGPSGSGKSSVVQAGLLPALRDDRVPGSAKWFVVEMAPGNHPLEELEAALLRIAINPPDSLLAQLRADDRGLVRALKRVLPDDPQVELLLYIDQFEEIFTQVTDEAERRHILDLLATAVEDPAARLRLIISLRADFYDRPLLYPRFGNLVRDNTEVVLPLSTQELEEAIVGPASRVGILPETGLVSEIIADVSEQPGMLPLLQYALTELFERRQGRILTLQAYQDSGGVRGALARRAEDTFTELAAEHQDLARQIFLRLVTLGEGQEDTRRRVLANELSALSPHADSVLQAFGRHRLLTFDRDSETRNPTVEVAHEALLREWQRLRGWLDESRDDVRQHRRLILAAAEWQNAASDPSYLLSGFRLEQFENWAADTRLQLNPTEQAYLQASLDQRAAQQAAEAERQARVSALERRARNILVALAGVFLVATVIASFLAVFAFTQQRRAEQLVIAEAAARLEAEAQAEANKSLALATGAQLALADDNTDQAIVLALTANETENPPIQAQRALAEAVFAPGTRRVLSSHQGIVQGLAFSPDGQFILSGGADGRLLLWNRATGTIVRAFTGHSGPLQRVVFSPNGETVFSASNDGTVIKWNVATGENLLVFGEHDTRVTTVNISPDGQWVVSGDANGLAYIWDSETGDIRHTLQGHTALIHHADFSPNGIYVLTASEDISVIRWNVATGENEFTYTEHRGRVNSIDFSPTGATFATAAASDNAIFVWDLQSGALLRRFAGHGDQPYDVAYSPDGSLLVSGAQDGSVRIWDVENGTQLTRFLGHDSGIEVVAFAPDGLAIASGGQDGNVRLWDLQSGAEFHRFILHDRPVYGVAYSPDGRLVAGGSWDHTISIWDVQTGRLMRRLGSPNNTDPFFGHTNWITQMEFTPDSRQIITASYDMTMILWDVQTGEIIRRFEGGHEARIWALDLSTDGQFVASASNDSTIAYWDVATGQLLWKGEGHDGPVRGIAISADGRYVLSGAGIDQTVRLWDAANGNTVRVMVGHEEWLWRVQFLADGNRAVSAASDGVIILWDLESGLPIREFRGHTGPVLDLAISPDQRWLISSASDTTLRVWDIETGAELRRFRGHTNGIWGVDISPDGQYALTGAGDNTIRLWDITWTLPELADWVNANRYVRDLTCVERTTYDVAPLCDE